MSVRGDAECKKALDRLVRQAREGMITGLEAGALIIQDSAQEKAPYITGTLRRSMTTEVLTTSEDSTTVLVGPSVEYGRIVEFGDASKRRIAKPYLRPAYDENRDRVIQKVRGIVAKKMKSTKGGK